MPTTTTTTESSNRRLGMAAEIAALTLTNALIFQAELAVVNSRVLSLDQIRESDEPVEALKEHWKFICDEINYVPIFRIARNVLVLFPPYQERERAIHDLIKAVQQAVTSRAALRHDLMGRVYHRLLLQAKHLGTYYTSVPAATLLLKLALARKNWASLDWSDTEALREFRIADLACGTGTLLMAAQQAVTDNFVDAKVERKESIAPADLSALHRVLIEDVLHGYDVLVSAIHLTASTLALLAPEVAFHKMHLYTIPLGQRQGDSLSLGSIDFLASRQLAVQFDLMRTVSARGSAKAVTGKGDEASQAPIPPLDFCVMNPPFVRSVGGNLLFGSLPTDTRKEMQKKLRELLNPTGRETTPVLASSTAGLGAVFVAAAHTHLKDNGRIALVLPAALTSGVAWEKTRRLFELHYVIEFLVVSHDPMRWNFSENTDLSEILVVARKKPQGEPVNGHVTRCVNLRRNPEKVLDGLALSRSLLRETPSTVGSSAAHQGMAPIQIEDEVWAEHFDISWDALRHGDWYGNTFAQTDLIRVAHFLRQHKVFFPNRGVVGEIPLVPLSKLGTLGPDRRDIYDGFAIVKTKTGYPALWGHDAEETLSMSLKPNAFLNPLTKKRPGRNKRNVDLLWPKAGRVMIAERMWLFTQKVVSVRLPEVALSNVWWPLRLRSENEKHEKALVLWLNSTLGLTQMISHRVPTRGPWVQFKKPSLKAMPVLDPGALGKRALSKLAKVFDEVADKELTRLPSMAEDGYRLKIDAALAEVLKLPDLMPLRAMLAHEPVICNIRL